MVLFWRQPGMGWLGEATDVIGQLLSFGRTGPQLAAALPDQIHLAQPPIVAYNSPRLAVLRARGHGLRSHGFVECFGKHCVTETAK
jgi:hypothetical protein